MSALRETEITLESATLNHPQKILIGGAEGAPQWLNLGYANRHGLIAGATGTGKTVTLQVLAEGFSNAGVPVFMADVKGDLSGITQSGKPHPKIDERVETIGITDFALASVPAIFWDIFGTQGHPLRTTISEMGPVLISRLLNLTDAQEGVLHIAFAVADDEGMLLLDMKDLRSMLNFVGENAKELNDYGHISKASVGAVQRKLLQLESEGAENFFGEPALEIADLMRTTRDGRGIVNILAADELMRSPKLYSTFLLWLLSELFETLPEVGDPEKPKLVFFFDEAHLLFDDAPKALVDKVEQVVRLIRSKGVGVYFVTQSPLDIPEDVLGQLGNRVQHALRAFTPKDQKAVKSAAQTFRANPSLETEEVITQLGVGEALVSTLEKKGEPSIVQRTLIRPPTSRMGPASDAERQAVIHESPVSGQYDTLKDRESAYEILQARAEKQASESAKEETLERASTKRRSTRQGYLEATTKSVLRSVGSSIGRQIAKALLRGILGSLRK
jgi:DNA helicase HerA-like ATPase